MNPDEAKTTPDLEGKEPSRRQTILDRFDFAKKTIGHRKLNELWQKWDRYYDNDYWAGSSRASYLTRHSSNELFEFVETTLPIITSRPPRPDIDIEPNIKTLNKFQAVDQAVGQQPEQQGQQPPEVPQAQQAQPGQSAYKQYLSKLSEWGQRLQKELVKIFRDTDMIEKSQESYREYGIKGNYALRSYFDPESQQIKVETIDLACCFPDPMKGNIDDCYSSWFIYADYKPVEEIQKKYGVEVSAEGDFDADGTFRYYNSVFTAVKNAISSTKRKGYALVIEMYSGPTDEEEDYPEPVYDESGKAKVNEAGEKVTMTKKRLAYPYGKIEIVIRNDRSGIIKTVPNPYKGTFGFFIGANFKRRGDIWGTSEAKNIEKHIHVKNMIMSNVTDNIKATGNPQKYKLQHVKEVVNNDPQKVYTVQSSTDVGNIQPPTMPNYIQNFLIYLDQDRDKKDGMTDAWRGLGAPGDSGTKTQALIAQSSGRMQPKVEEWLDLYRKLYQLWTFIIRNLYPDEIIQKDEDKAGKVSYGVFRTKEFKDVNVKVDVNAMSMMPFDNYIELQEAIALNTHTVSAFGYPVISVEQLIDISASLRDKQRAKEYAADMQKQQLELQQAKEIMAREQTKAQAAGQFAQLAPQIAAVSESQGGSEEEEQGLNAVAELVMQNKDILDMPEFQALPSRFKKGVGMLIADRALAPAVPA